MHHRPLVLIGPLAAFTLALSGLGPARAGVFLDPLFGVNVTNDVVYGTGQIGYPDNLRDIDLRLDLYQPTGVGLPALLPGMVLIHGGGFTGGEKSLMSGLATEFASRGYVATTIEYRLRGGRSNRPPPAPYTAEGQDPLLTNAIYAAFVDAVTAVNWLRNSADDLNVDADRIVVGGHSAGAITSLFVGMAHNNSTSTVPPVGNAALIPGVEVAAILDIAGCLCRSGLSLVDPADPATYIVHGRQDNYEDATDLAAALTAAGVPVGFPQIDGDHIPFEDLLNTDLGNGQLVSDDMFSFFHEQLELQALVVDDADFDRDGDVDGQDFLTWQRGATPTPLSAEDFAVWKANYGMVATLSASSAALPEPTTSVLALAAICLAIGRRQLAAQ